MHDPMPGNSPVVTYAPRKRGLAVTALVLGISAFILGWLPFIGLIIGLIGVGIAIAALATGQSKGFAITGLVLASIAAATSLLMSLAFPAFIDGFKEGMDMANQPSSSSPAPSASDSEEEAAPTEVAPESHGNSCGIAAMRAVEEQEELYRTHPMYTEDAPGPNAPTTEQERWWSVVDDEEQQWQAIIEPLYTECGSPQELYDSLKAHPDIAGFTSSDAVDPFVIEAWCYDSTDEQPACRDWEAWYASNSS